MPDTPTPPRLRSKGERTAERIRSAATTLFARQGYEGTSLRQIATAAGIREPGLYNHFSNKRALYESVLARALDPMTQVLSEQLGKARGLHDYTELPSLMTNILLENPQTAYLFQQAMQGAADSPGHQLVRGWLENLCDLGMHAMVEMGPRDDSGREVVALKVIAIFNVTIGYFLARRVFDSMVAGDITNPATVDKQKRLLHSVIRAMLIG